MKKVLFLCSVATSTLLACTDSKQSFDLLSDGYTQSSDLSETFDPEDTLRCASIIDTITRKQTAGYDDICYDEKNDLYYVDIPLSIQHKYRDEDQVFVLLHPKALYGGTVSLTTDTPPLGKRYFVAIIERKSDLGGFK